MNIPFLHQQIILETERLRDMHRSMMMHNSAIAASEMEAFLMQLRKLYEAALQLSNENSMQLLNEVLLANASSAEINEAGRQKNFVNKPNENSTVQHTDEKVIAAEKLQPSQAQKNEVTAEVSSPVQKAEKNIENKSGTYNHSQQQQSNQSGKTIANKFTGTSSVADKMAGTETSKRFSENIKLPVSDINSAIGINEKFQFINQLFHGDSQKYSQFVNELNSCPSADVAKKSIQRIAESNHWESIPIAKHFIEVVERRFA